MKYLCKGLWVEADEAIIAMNHAFTIRGHDSNPPCPAKRGGECDCTGPACLFRYENNGGREDDLRDYYGEWVEITD